MSDLNIFFYLSWLLQAALFALFIYKHYLNYAIPKKSATSKAAKAKSSVCVQVPVYNEPKHIKGVIESVANLDWPHELLEIQILDDSTDTTTRYALETIENLKTLYPTLQISHIKRSSRDGFKAGALNHGLKQTNAKYCAIFDADFRPEPNWLKTTIPEMENNPNACALQTPWSFTNEFQNPLTRLQGLQLRLHFYIEHCGRHHRGLCFNFNGTGGLWRTESLRKLGGWSSNSVTEDLYLSYMAQLKGMDLIFCDSTTSPSELPPDIHSYLIQQRRWALGSGQVTKLLFKEESFLKNLRNHRGWDMLTHLSGYFYGLFGAALFSSTLILLCLLNLSSGFYSEELLQLNRLTWLIVMLSYFSLCLSKNIGSYSSYSLTNRLKALFYLMILSPVLMIFISYKFLHGLTGSLTKSKNLIFHRTPKKNGGFKSGTLDKTIFTAIMALITLTAINSLMHGAHIVGGFLALQLICLTAIRPPIKVFSI